MSQANIVMPKYQQILCLALTGLTALIIGMATQQLYTDKPTGSLFISHFKNSTGDTYPIKKIKGQLVLLNFWATWCPPCRKEVPDFIRLHEDFQDRGFTVIGLAIDKAEKVRAFEQEMGINYPSLIAEKEGYALMEEYGSLHGALPYTVILDRQGKLVYQHHKGVLSYAEAQKLIEPLL